MATHSWRIAALLGVTLLLAAGPDAAASPVKPSTTRKKPSHSTSRGKSGKGRAVSAKSRRGKRDQGWRNRQRNIDSLRVREIQSALIRQHYLEGEPNGAWDARTKSAMMKYQQDNGWQSKKLPDARALIKLGLGPDRANLINPDTAYIPHPEPGKGGSPQN